MTPPSGANDPHPGRRDDGHSSGDRATRRLTAVRLRFEGSWVQEFAARLRLLDFGTAVVFFGAALLLSVLPLIILLGSIAHTRIDDDLSRHIGLNSRGARIVEGLFPRSPTHSAGSIVLGFIVAFLGTMALVGSLQLIYERVFDQEHRGWRDVPRYVLWVVVLFAVLIAEGIYDDPVRSAAGPVVRGLLTFVVVTIFFLWTMHFLLAGRVPWRSLVRPAFVTALLWVGLALFSSLYFSSALISEDRLYGTIGAVFILLTWFIAVGAVVVLGAALGAVWQERKGGGAASRLRRTQDEPDETRRGQ